MNLEKTHQQLLQLLIVVNQLCRDKDINYSLFGGTLIGAIREKNFLAWDDDADIVFTRENFNKFLKHLPNDAVVENKLWVRRFYCSSISNELYVDIFILDKVPKYKLIYFLQRLLIRILQGMMKEKLELKSFKFVEKILLLTTFLAGKLFTQKIKFNLYDRVAKWGNNFDSDYFASYLDQYRYLSNKIAKDSVSEYIDVAFASQSLMAMKGYDNYLKTFYGNYLSPPPKEEQVPSHGNV